MCICIYMYIAHTPHCAVPSALYVVINNISLLPVVGGAALGKPSAINRLAISGKAQVGQLNSDGRTY